MAAAAAAMRGYIVPLLLVLLSAGGLPTRCASFSVSQQQRRRRGTFCFFRSNTALAYTKDWDSTTSWGSSSTSDVNLREDWQAAMLPDTTASDDWNIWSTFESSDEEEEEGSGPSHPHSGSAVVADKEEELVDESEAWLETLASISAGEVEFNRAEAEKADKVRQMQEWGFDAETVGNTYGVAVGDGLEGDDVDGMKEYREEAYLDDGLDGVEDWELVESHTRVELDPDTNEPVRAQMMYVDEDSCVGCYLCSNVAPSTFMMESEHGRARVFSQWGDDDETIETAIDTCPVDCIHYVPFEELKRLEIERRDQSINFKARLVNQAMSGANSQVISGNMGSRCGNCPSRGCQDCPMFGVGKNPEFEKREKQRLEKKERRRLQKTREDESKTAEL